MTQGIARLNALSSQEAQAELLKCCGSTNWARRMAQQRPFPTGGDAMRRLLDAADRVWWDLGREDWLEAFTRHPRIGEKAAAKDASAETRRWSEEEQSGTRSAREQVLAALAKANRAYEQRFGYIFIVCATGKSSEEMLALLQQRLQNDPAAELRMAAEEQRRITHLRLQKLLQA
ncbi:MAG: 2-oxo-4-hydroxy-4-carboxy-5-ureidoimidazoline decarboxylase [Acidobacteria bacterium]|nr:MAG: 2-oxo-4-hydroxy-4-carboxy-5-ureidoimidazoline decarboxylase [Acidobacteriota bacterium]